MSDLNRKPLQIWECKIGECPDGSLPNAADCPMRDAVAEAYERISGHKPAFIFSGWNAELTEGERAAHENRLPRDPTPGPLTREPRKYHHPNCSLNATNGPDGDFCNCKMVVDYSEYAALRATIAQQAQEMERLERQLELDAQQIQAVRDQCKPYTDMRDHVVEMVVEVVNKLAAMTTNRGLVIKERVV